MPSQRRSSFRLEPPGPRPEGLGGRGQLTSAEVLRKAREAENEEQRAADAQRYFPVGPER